MKKNIKKEAERTAKALKLTLDEFNYVINLSPVEKKVLNLKAKI